MREIASEARQARRASDRPPLGIRRILHPDPHAKPGHSNRSPAPRLHAKDWQVRKGLELAYYDFRIRFRQAAEELKLGKRGVRFPPGCFPPRLPFIRGQPLLA